MSYIQVYPLQISQSMSMSGAYVLVLDAPENGKQVPIIIGEAEAQAIVMAIEQKQARRPLTHNLLNNILEEYLLVLKQVTIDRFEEGIFYSTLYISDGFSEKRIDSRTSDAIVLALLQHCNIMIENRVLEETSMEPGALENNLPQNRSKSQSDTLTLEQLEELLHECEEKEDYEQAAEIMEKINRMKNEGLES
jgi:bifunctional DNase/RNase